MCSRRPSRPIAVATLLAGLAAGLAGCSGGDATPVQQVRTARDIVRAVDRALDIRAHDVRRGDADAFEATLGGGADFHRQQDTWFGNMTQLPIARLGYRAEPASLVRDGDAYWVVVKVSLQLAGYDARPVVSIDRYRFAPRRHHPGRLLLTSVTDRAWESDHDVRPQPWDEGPVQVREGSGVLGVFDARSVDTAPGLLASVESGIASVSAAVPYDWSRSVVVYALSDPTFLDGLEDVPGDDPGDLDAVAFPVGGGTRFVLNPSMLDKPGRERDRLIRHELTHVAVGTRDDHAPVWLSEGIAEYVAVRPLAPQQRRIPAAALSAAEAGLSDLPDDETFNAKDSDAHYGIAWWAVEYIADTYGKDAPWALLDAMSQPDADPDVVLEQVLGTTTEDLAHHAERLILSLYDPGSGVT
jgi:hypothetical protein